MNIVIGPAYKKICFKHACIHVYTWEKNELKP